MRLLQLTLHDFGVFQGKNTFFLEPVGGSIVLIGGKNGAGKTTLLEAIRICLYGALAFGARTTRKEYDETILRKFHRRQGILVPVNHASVCLRFEYAQLGYSHEYEVTRAWKLKGTSSLTEQLIVKKDNLYLADMAEERWQDFIDDLIPAGVANLFFFDGEKIQSLASDDLGEQFLGEEIKRLLGLSVVEKLQQDLDVYLYRQRKDSLMMELTHKVEDAQKNRDVIETEYQVQRQERSQTEAFIALIRGKVDDLEQRISRESSGFGMARNTLRDELSRVEAELGQTTRGIHDLAEKLLPFSLLPELCQKVRKQLAAEAQYQQWEASLQLMEPRIQRLKQRFENSSLIVQDISQVSPELKFRIARQISDLLEDLLAPPGELTTVQMRHNLSEPERMQLLAWIDQALTDVPGQIKQLSDFLDDLERKRQNIESNLRKVPEDEVLRPLMDELNQQHRRLGELDLIAGQQEKKLSSLNNRRQEAQRQLQKAYEALRGGEELDYRLQLVTKSQLVLDNFLKRLTQEKLLHLQELVVNRFNEIIQKADLIQRVSIDPEEFHIKIYNAEDYENSQRRPLGWGKANVCHRYPVGTPPAFWPAFPSGHRYPTGTVRSPAS